MSGRLLITKSEAAEQLGVSLRTIERLIAAGRLPLVHVEGAARVRVADLGAYVQGLHLVIRRGQMTAQYNEGEIFRSTASIARDNSPPLTP